VFAGSNFSAVYASVQNLLVMALIVYILIQLVH